MVYPASHRDGASRSARDGSRMGDEPKLTEEVGTRMPGSLVTHLASQLGAMLSGTG